MGIRVCLMVLLLAESAAAQVYKPGDEVVVIADGNLSVGKSSVEKVWPGLVLQVGMVNGNWLWLNYGKPGWLDQRHVVSLDRAAISRLTEMIGAKPNDSALYYGRAYVWLRLGEIDSAISDYNEAIRLNPSAANYSGRGLAWDAKEEYDKAIADYDEAIRLDPNVALAYNNRGNAWKAKGEYERAIADYNDALRLDPKSAIAANNRGHAWIALGEYDKAIVDFNEALRLDSRYDVAYGHRGLANWAKGDYSKAKADFYQVLRLNPTNRYAAILGHITARLDGDDRAAKEFLTAAGADDEWPYPAVRFLRGEIDESALLAMADDDDKRTEARCYLGLVHEIAGRRDAALAHFRWVKEHGTKTFDEYGIALAELRRMEGAAK